MASTHKKIRYLVQSVGINNEISLYRNPSKTSNKDGYSTISPGYQFIVDRVTSDGKFYRIAADQSWIAASNINILSKNPSANIRNDTKYNLKVENPNGVDSFDSFPTDQHDILNILNNPTISTSDIRTAGIQKTVPTKESNNINKKGATVTAGTPLSDTVRILPKEPITTIGKKSGTITVAANPGDGSPYTGEGTTYEFEDDGTPIIVIPANDPEDDDDDNSGLVKTRGKVIQGTTSHKFLDLKKTGPVHREGSNIVSDVLLEPVKASAKSSENIFSSNAAAFAGIFGMPYQFSANVDRRIGKAKKYFNGVIGGKGRINDGLGHKFADKIIARNNLLFLSPGVQDFMAGASDIEKAGVLYGLFTGDEEAQHTASESLEKYTRYYTLKFDFDNYFKYVNSMCHSVAHLMGIHREEVTIAGQHTTLGRFDWREVLNSKFQKYSFAQNNVVFYTDGFNSVSEDFGNDSRESSLVSSVNTLSDQAKEVNFITNSNFGESALGDAGSSIIAEINQTLSGLKSGRGVLEGILGNTSTLMSGGKLVFPELWGDSSFDRSYSLSFKFRSPESDPVSIYLNIMVPYIHLIAMTAPHDYDTGIGSEANGYVSPFLVRAFYRGMFNIEMGLITSLSSEKGGEGMWSMDGLPTSLDVSMTIKDLYKSMYISKLKGANPRESYRFIGNDGMMDYLMNMAGVNLTEPVAEKRAKLAMALIGDGFLNLPGNLGSKIRNDLTNALYGYLG